MVKDELSIRDFRPADVERLIANVLAGWQKSSTRPPPR